jgi:hypothetical protein
VTYLLDANVFIEAKNRYYAFNLCPAFWTWLDHAAAAGTVASVGKVGEELRAVADELTEWAQSRPSLFLDPDERVVQSLRVVGQWANSNNYRQAAINEFLESGDYYLVGHAHAHNLTIVTHEIASEGLKKIKIPNACQGVGVRYMDPWAMLTAEGALFVLDEATGTE